MKRFLSHSIPAVFIALSLLIIPLSYGDDILETFIGGVYNMSIMQNSALLSGIGTYETAAGVGITTLRPTPAAIYWNPAGLAFLKNGGIIIEAIPEISYSPDIAETVNEEVDAQLASFDTSSTFTKIYPDFTLEGGQGAQAVSSMAFAFPYQNFYFAFSYCQNYSLQMNLIGAGIENVLISEELNPNDNTTIFIRTDVNLLLDLVADEVAFAAGRKITDYLGVGMTLSRYNADANIIGILAPEGVFSQHGSEKSFNDPSAGWQNDFYSSMEGNFNGSAWGTKIGVAYQPKEWLSVNFMASVHQNLVLDGDMEIIQYFYPALNLDPDEAAGEENFDIGKVSPTQPTETILADNLPGDELKIDLPSSVSLGVAYRGISLTMTGYSNQLSYSFDLARDGIPATYARGFKPKYGFLLGFDLKFLRLSFGGIAGDEIINGYKDDNGVPEIPTLDLIIPRFNLGTGFKIGENWKMDILFFGVPDLFGSVLKVGATYSF